MIYVLTSAFAFLELANSFISLPSTVFDINSRAAECVVSVQRLLGTCPNKGIYSIRFFPKEESVSLLSMLGSCHVSLGGL